MFTLKSIAAAATIILSAGASYASSFNGSYWNATSFNSIDQVYSYIETNEATATFDSTTIDYPGAAGSISDATTLQEFLGATGDGLSLSGAFNNRLEKSVFTFSGILNLNGLQSIKVGSDDGFGLKLDGVEVLRHSAPRAFGYTSGSHTFTGSTAFELIYYENYGYTGVEFQINDQIVSSAMSVGNTAVPSVPLPAGLPLMAGALAGFGLLRARAAKFV